MIGTSGRAALVAAPARRHNPKLRELAGLAIRLYRPAMLLHDDVVADGTRLDDDFLGRQREGSRECETLRAFVKCRFDPINGIKNRRTGSRLTVKSRRSMTPSRSAPVGEPRFSAI